MVDIIHNSLRHINHNVLLHSETGTGKTQAILCGVLSWMRNQASGNDLKVIFASRTHKQLT